MKHPEKSKENQAEIKDLAEKQGLSRIVFSLLDSILLPVTDSELTISLLDAAVAALL